MYTSVDILRGHAPHTSDVSRNDSAAAAAAGVHSPQRETVAHVELARLKLLLEHATLKEKLKQYQQAFQESHGRKPTSGAVHIKTPQACMRPSTSAHLPHRHLCELPNPAHVLCIPYNGISGRYRIIHALIRLCIFWTAAVEWSEVHDELGRYTALRAMLGKMEIDLKDDYKIGASAVANEGTALDVDLHRVNEACSTTLQVQPQQADASTAGGAILSDANGTNDSSGRHIQKRISSFARDAGSRRRVPGAGIGADDVGLEDRIFAMDLPEDAHVGDVCNIVLPDGTTVELEIPNGATQPGCVVEFAVPSSLSGGASEGEANAPFIVANAWVSRQGE